MLAQDNLYMARVERETSMNKFALHIAYTFLICLLVWGCGSSASDANTDSGGGGDVNLETDSSPTPDADQDTNTDTAGTDVSDTQGTDSSTNTDTIGNPDQSTSTDSDSSTTDTGQGTFGEEPEFTDLFIQIIGPTGKDSGTNISGLMPLSGILFGEATSITWTASDGATGQITPGRFWNSGPIQLAPGDNTITVTALSADGQEASDEVVITYNPGFQFGDYLEVQPPQLFTNKTTDMRASIAMGSYGTYDASTVKLHRVDASGVIIETIATMKDDGQVATTCDEIEGDGVFSTCMSRNPSQPETLHFRVTVEVPLDLSVYDAYSPVTDIEAISPVSPGICQSVVQLTTSARNTYEDRIADGQSHEDAQAAALSVFTNFGEVTHAGVSPDGYGLWMRHQTGLLGVVGLAPEGYRSGDTGTVDGGLTNLSNQRSLLSRHSMVFAPYREDLGTMDESIEIKSSLEDVECPPFSVQEYVNADAQLSKLRSIYEFGVIAFATHGEVMFDGIEPGVADAYGWENEGAQEVLWTGEEINCNNLSPNTPVCESENDCATGSACIAVKVTAGNIEGRCVDLRHGDLLNGRIALSPDRYAVLPSFFSHYAHRDYPESLIYMGACRTIMNGTLAAAFFANGAVSIAGFSDYVTESFVKEQGTYLFEQLLLKNEDTGQGINLTGDVLPGSIEDPETGGKFWLFGAQNLSIMNADLVNPSWENGGIAGWDQDGDGRVISQLGCYAPVQGKYMGLLSTGLGFTKQTGELSQRFCIPKDKTELRVRWRFMSEEFPDFCGSIFQDEFRATLESDLGEMDVVNVWVDSLCQPSLCPFTEACGIHYVGLDQACVAFDQGDVWTTPWREAVVDVTPFAGQGPTTLRLFASDQGDSIYDTVILVDDIRFK
ncbi:MAG: hypothetical protein CMH54_06845 [Myxococcales bacterium]|nr:hypothetical protein [Myxococcales bacterium]